MFVAGGGTGDGSSADSPLGSLTKAMDLLDLSEDCTIVICGTFTQSVNWVYYDKSMYDGSVTYTSVYDGVDYRETNGATYQFTQVRFYCYGDTRFENITFESIKSNLLVIAQHNPVTVGEGVVMKGRQPRQLLCHPRRMAKGRRHPRNGKRGRQYHRAFGLEDLHYPV